MRRKLGKFPIYGLLVMGSALFLIPLLWMISTSLKAEGAIFVFPPQWIPKSLHWENYKTALTILPFATFFKNTCIITFFSLVGTLLSSSLVAFGFARLRFPGRRVLFMVLLGTMMIPYPVTLIPMYILFNRLGWVDTFLPLIVPSFFGSAFFIFLLRQYYLSIPLELDDAARIDGCGSFQIFYRIHLPLIKPALITVAILNFMGTWNDFLGPLIYLQSQEHYTLALGLNIFKGMYSTDWNLLMAASLVVLVPTVILFFFAQKRIIGGIALTGLKQ